MTDHKDALENIPEVPKVNRAWRSLTLAWRTLKAPFLLQMQLDATRDELESLKEEVRVLQEDANSAIVAAYALLLARHRDTSNTAWALIARDLGKTKIGAPEYHNGSFQRDGIWALIDSMTMHSPYEFSRKLKNGHLIHLRWQFHDEFEFRIMDRKNHVVGEWMDATMTYKQIEQLCRACGGWEEAEQDS